MAVKGLNVWIVEVGDGFDETAKDVSKVLWLGWVMLHTVRKVVDASLDVILKDAFFSEFIFLHVQVFIKMFYFNV